MDLGLGIEGSALPAAPAAIVILLDTNALIWLERNHPRARPLRSSSKQLYISPANLLELQILMEAGRLRLRDRSVSDLAGDPRWLLDDPTAAAWFEEALGLGWTRDPFDRLIVAHARIRGWRVATGDLALSDRLSSEECIRL
jgi:PIN domain nuclease of toxin-antitoxin system